MIKRLCRQALRSAANAATVAAMIAIVWAVCLAFGAASTLYLLFGGWDE